tara:strand:+ start:58 stop:426 length:369 start_codon:yes stop_codon:yes gene_type:complete
MITIELNENSGITTGQIPVYDIKKKITGLVNVKTNGVNWYFSAVWKYGDAKEYATGKAVTFDNLPYGLDRAILNDEGKENYPTTDGGFTDFKKDIYRVCDRYKQVLEEEIPSLVGQITVTGL